MTPRPFFAKVRAIAWHGSTVPPVGQCDAKGGIESFCRTLATELAPHKITVNYIRPGATFTELTTPMYTPAVKRSLFERVPLKEIAQPEWIAAAAVFLASDEPRYTTGQHLTVDGGYIMDGRLPSAEYCKE